MISTLSLSAHELLDCVDVDAGVLGVHAGDTLFGADDAVGLADVDDVDQVPQHSVEHDLLFALVREEVLADLHVRHLDLELLAEDGTHVGDELVDVRAVAVVTHVVHDLVADGVVAALLNCTNQLVMHILNARLRSIVERAVILDQVSQEGGRAEAQTSI